MSGAQSTDRAFDQRSRVQRMLEFEAALARALAHVGVISDAAAGAIAGQCTVALFDLAAIEREAESAGNEAIPMVEQLRALVAAADRSAATYVHWGATSQDAIDTALVLQLRDALDEIDEELARLVASLVDMVESHAATPMVGRTLLQEAAPTTFGFKAAGWLDALLRHRTHLTAARNEVCVLQLGGAVGNLSALGNNGPRIAAAVAEELRLSNPEMSWHANRDRFVNVATTLASMTGTLGKIARDVALLAQSEIAEVREPASPGRGRSSTIPQKRNPVACASILAAALRTPALAATMLSVMIQEHERGLGGWHAEWETLPEIVRLSRDALTQATLVVGGLEVDVVRMARNLDTAGGLVFAESASFALMARLGRGAASEIVHRAIQRCSGEGLHLREALKADPAVAAVLSSAEIDALFDVRRHIGVAEQTARRVAATARASLGSPVDA